jgi:hypothetical protein
MITKRELTSKAAKAIRARTLKEYGVIPYVPRHLSMEEQNGIEKCIKAAYEAGKRERG